MLLINSLIIQNLRHARKSSYTIWIKFIKQNKKNPSEKAKSTANGSARLGAMWGGCGIPQDQNHTVNEIQSINQVETNIEIQRRLVQEDIYRVL
jgi:hypothetical protein